MVCWMLAPLLLRSFDMSIHVYTGTPGSGKSLHAASDIRFQLTRKYPRPVIANFDLGKKAPVSPKVRNELFHYIPNDEMSADAITSIADRYWSESGRPFQEDYITLVIDECQLLFNSRLWTQKSRMQYLEFLSQSRKVGIKVILIAQATKMIDNQFRMLIEIEHNHRRVSSFGPIGAAVALPFGGRLFLVVRYLYQCNERLGMSLFRGSRLDLKMYDSYVRFAQA